MYVMTSNGAQIINSDFVERFVIVEKPDAALILASYTSANEPPPVTIGRYKDRKEAQDALEDMFSALASKFDCYTMPDSVLFFEEHTKKDARTKRKGGS